MAAYLFRSGDGNQGNYPREVVTLKDSDSPYSAVAALVANGYIAGGRVRRHIVRTIQTDGEAAYGVCATVYEGPDGEEAYGAAWITAELQPLTEEDAAHYERQGMTPTPIRELLDNAALRMFRKGNERRTLITFDSGIDIRSRSVTVPTVARFAMGDGTYRYIVIGTAYGHLHTTGGDVRTWGSYSGARRAAKAYKPL